MNIWIITDTHFNHAKLNELGRGEGWEKELIAGLRSIPKEDMLIHLGDIGIGKDSEVHDMLFKDLHGALLGQIKRTILVRGNHDKKSAAWYLEHGWGAVTDGFFLKFEGKRIDFSHKPQEPVYQNVDYNFHGHTHGNQHRDEEHKDFYDPKYHKDFSPELMGYKPIRLDTFLKKIAHETSLEEKSGT